MRQEKKYVDHFWSHWHSSSKSVDQMWREKCLEMWNFIFKTLKNPIICIANRYSESFREALSPHFTPQKCSDHVHHLKKRVVFREKNNSIFFILFLKCTTIDVLWHIHFCGVQLYSDFQSVNLAKAVKWRNPYEEWLLCQHLFENPRN